MKIRTLFQNRHAAAAFLGVGACLVSPSVAQNPAQPQYQGMQPELVRGVEDGMATGAPKLRHVYLAAPDVLALAVDAQNLWSDPLQEYKPQPGDEIRRQRPQNYGTAGHAFYWTRTIIRHGEKLGELVGWKEDHYAPPYRLRGEKLDLAWAENPESYALSSTDDPAYPKPEKPLAIYRKSKPEMLEWTVAGKQEASLQHELYLKLPRPLTPGKSYRVELKNSALWGGKIEFKFDDHRLRTEAIEVNQVGYYPAQEEKIAFLSMWLGNGGGVDFSPLPEFTVVDDRDGTETFRGKIALRKTATPDRIMAPEKTDDPGDELPSAVYALDFSAFAKPGVYCVVVPGLGSSFPFRIDAEVWRDAAKMAAHGYYNQRSGLALGAPYSKYPRPRDLHPADGFMVHRTDPKLFFDESRITEKKGSNSFQRIQVSILENTNVPNAWGGWHDAADYDRSILPQNHPRAVHAMLDLVTANPAYFEKFSLHIPESGNAIPDLVDEALWCMELFRRIQQPDGGVPSAVESIEHPSEPSWLLGQPTAITPPTPQSCEVYAAAAAQLALVLEKYDAKLAASYRESAERAMDWAAKNPDVPNIYANTNHPLLPDEVNAAFWLFRLTGEEKWHAIFRSKLAELFPKGEPRFDHYALLPDGVGDASLREQCRASLQKAADADVRDATRWTYHLGPQRYNSDARLGNPATLIAAHRLTGDARYLHALEEQAQLALGRNPSNASYTTGLGSRQVVPFNLEARYLGSAYPEGISTQGPAPRNVWRGASSEEKLQASGLFPEWKYWPWVESNFNIREPNLNEHVVGGNMACQLSLRAYLAQAFH